MRGRSDRISVRATNMAWGTPFPQSRMPASIENSIKLSVWIMQKRIMNIVSRTRVQPVHTEKFEELLLAGIRNYLSSNRIMSEEKSPCRHTALYI
jgi:hypothetical protein